MHMHGCAEAISVFSQGRLHIQMARLPFMEHTPGSARQRLQARDSWLMNASGRFLLSHIWAPPVARFSLTKRFICGIFPTGSGKEERASETSRYQLFVKAMTAKLKSEDPTCNQTDRMKTIGLLWRAMSVEERDQIIAAQRRWGLLANCVKVQ